jgi:hypothetical protein
MKAARLLCCVALPVACCAAGLAHGAERTPFQVRCEDSIAKTVSVLSAQQNGYSINNQMPYRMLTAMKGVHGNSSYVLGLTKTESKMSVALGGPILQDAASGYECIAPRIEVKLYYAPVVVYIGSEFAPGTCGYQEILTHELRHLKAYTDHLPKVEKTVREALAKRFGDKPLYAPSGTAMSALQHEMNSGWLPYMKNEMAKAEPLQAAIDSPQEYARLSKACNGEIQAIITRRRPSPRQQ